MNIKVNDIVELLRDELLDDNYHDYKRTKIPKGTKMKVVAITPKVRMIKGQGCDSKPNFLNLEIPNSNIHNRVRTNFCNIKKI
jgi:hypothetical protein